jgi:hypothetical protein
VVITCPVTVPYVRYSIRGAHWFLAAALADLLKRAGLAKDKLDGLCVSSFTLAPDSAVGLTQHLGLTLRWLDHIPMGGACGIVALRRAARAVPIIPIRFGTISRPSASSPAMPSILMAPAAPTRALPFSPPTICAPMAPPARISARSAWRNGPTR